MTEEDAMAEYVQSKDGTKLKVMVEDLSNLVNNFGFKDGLASKLLAAAFMSQHRTLQQSMCRLLAGTLKEIAKKYNENPRAWEDDRNVSSMGWIVKVTAIEEYFPMI